MLTITSADVPWRLVLPLEGLSRWRFTDVNNDPRELNPLERWTPERLANDAQSLFGEEASRWIREANAVAQWWVSERKRLWGYNL